MNFCEITKRNPWILYFLLEDNHSFNSLKMLKVGLIRNNL